MGYLIITIALSGISIVLAINAASSRIAFAIENIKTRAHKEEISGHATISLVPEEKDK